MEETVAEFFLEIDAALYVVDCLPNMSPATVTNRTVALVQYIRKVWKMHLLQAIHSTDSCWPFFPRPGQPRPCC